MRMFHIRTLARPLALLAIVTAVAGCTFSWDSAGIKDVAVVGRDPAKIGPQGEPKNPDGTATNADAAAVAPAPAPAPQKDNKGDEKSALQKIAILPVAYRDASGGLTCDLCAGASEMKPTSALAARLVTGFLYEAIARHPRLLFPPPEVVDRAVAAAPGRSLRAAAASLAATGKADLVVATELLELRPRIGPDDAPEQPAGAALYVALVNARDGKVLWSDTFDANEGGRNLMLRVYDKVMNDKPVRWHTAEEFSEHAVDELIADLVDEVD